MKGLSNDISICSGMQKKHNAKLFWALISSDFGSTLAQHILGKEDNNVTILLKLSVLSLAMFELGLQVNDYQKINKSKKNIMEIIECLRNIGIYISDEELETIGLSSFSSKKYESDLILIGDKMIEETLDDKTYKCVYKDDYKEIDITNIVSRYYKKP